MFNNQEVKRWVSSLHNSQKCLCHHTAETGQKTAQKKDPGKAFIL